jgi:hypothetical protein
MATLRKQEAEWRWPPELATFDPQRRECRAAWHLARAHAAPSKLVALQEIRASLGTPGAVDRAGGVVIVGPPGGS